MIKKLKSLCIYFWIQALRFFDHSFRLITGAPTLKHSLVTPNLVLGGQYGSGAFNKFSRLKIGAVVNMRTTPTRANPRFKDLKTLHLPTPDKKAPSLNQLQKGVRFITSEIKKGGTVYIHCKYGEQRGATMVIAYLISTGLTLDDAFEIVKKVRPFVHPTKDQLARLKEFEYTNTQ